MVTEAKTFMVENAQLLFKNFRGEGNQYNREGDRNFNVVLEPDVAEAMKADGWNVKYLPAREEGEVDTPIIQVKVSFKNRPPMVTIITSNSRTRLDEGMIGMLDHADILTVDFIANAYEWEVGDKRGIAAYLQTMFVTLREDALQMKYGIHEGENV